MAGKNLIWIVMMATLMMANSEGLVEIDNATLNTTISNTSFNPDINITLFEVIIESRNITLNNMSYGNGELGVDIAHNVTLNETNSHFNTTMFPQMASSDDFTKNITMLLNRTLNAVFRFNAANCDNLSVINYTSSNNSFFRRYTLTNITCSNNRVALHVEGIEPIYNNNGTRVGGNIFNLLYIPGWRTVLAFGLVGIASLLVYIGRNIQKEHYPVANLMFLTSFLFLFAATYVMVRIGSPGGSDIDGMTNTIFRFVMIVTVAYSTLIMITFIIQTIKMLKVKS